MTSEIRPLTNEERAILEIIARPRNFRFSEWIGLVFMSTFAIWGLAYYGLVALFPSFRSLALPFFAFVLIAVFLCAWWYYIRRSRREVKSVEMQELMEGNAEVSTFEIRKAVQVEEFEDEGIGFYLETSDGKTLYLQGQYLYDFENFPSTRIEVVRTPKSRTRLIFKSFGSPLAVSSKLSPFTPKDHELGRAHYDGDLLDQSLEDCIRQKLA